MIAVWKQASLAFSVEAASLAMLGRSSSDLVLASYFGLHAVGSLLSASMALALLPANYRQPAAPAFLLMFCFAFFFPAVGVAMMVLMARIVTRFPKILRTERYAQVYLPEFAELPQEITVQDDVRASQARRILKDLSQPLETRLRVLVALQSMQPKAAVPLLLSLLSDPSEDIRLLAYSIVDTWEKDLAQRIDAGQLRLALARKQDDRAPLVNALQTLAELHWQQVDAGLARGDLRTFELERSQGYCEDMLMLDPYAPGAWSLYAKVLIERGQLAVAARALAHARKLQIPLAQILPLMAQIAYLHNDYTGVRRYIARLPPDTYLPQHWRGAARYWRRRRVAGVDLHV